MINEQSEKIEITTNELTAFLVGVMNDNKANNSDRLKAADMLAKRIGFYEKENQQKQQSVMMVNIDPLSEPLE